MSAVPETPPAAERPLLFRGFAPLVVALILAVLAVVLVPSVAPEHIVIETPSTTTRPLPTTVPTP